MRTRKGRVGERVGGREGGRRAYLIRLSGAGVEEVVVGHEHQVGLEGVLPHEVVGADLKREGGREGCESH